MFIASCHIDYLTKVTGNVENQDIILKNYYIIFIIKAQ